MSHHRRRAAFDVGSGSTKLMVSDVTVGLSPPSLHQILHQEEVGGLMEEYTHSSTGSDGDE